MNKIYRFFLKIFMCTIIFLILGIFSKKNYRYREKIHYYLYEDNINFYKIIEFYEKYLGGISYIDDKKNIESKAVFKEKQKYTSVEEYKNGVRVKVEKQYPILNMYDGIVTYIDKNKKYIIKNKENIDIEYNDVCNSKLKLYDKVQEGEYIGVACDDYLYVDFKKNNKYLDYKKYLK